MAKFICEQKINDEFKKSDLWQGIDALDRQKNSRLISPFQFRMGTKERQNNISWLPFKGNEAVLDLYAGCGTLTEYLCAKGCQVDSIEPNISFAQICHERNRHNESLEVLAMELKDALNRINKRYDYIIIEERFFSEGHNSHCDMTMFFEQLKKHLNPQGKVFLMVTNRLGLSYLLGSPENGTGTFFGNVDMLRADNSSSFTESEISGLLKTAGFDNVKVYYPYPDLICPSEIFTKESLEPYHYGRDYYFFDDHRVELFREPDLISFFTKEHIVDKVTNAFLIEASYEEEQGEQLIYAKINSDRAEEFRIITKILRVNDTKFIEKKALSEKSVQHILHMNEMENRVENTNRCLLGAMENDAIRYPFITFPCVKDTVYQAIEEGDKDRIQERMDWIYQNVICQGARKQDFVAGQAFKQVFGNEPVWDAQDVLCINPANIDLILDNIFETENGPVTIDNEWFFDFDVPVQFVMWRTIHELYCQNNSVNQLIPKDAMMEWFDISKDMSNIFAQWNQYFTEEYVKANWIRLQHSVKKRQFDLNATVARDWLLDSTMFWDFGDGFREEQKEYRECVLDGDAFTLVYRFDSSNTIRQFRWDPTERRLCNCYVEAFINGIAVQINAQNAIERKDGWDYFDTEDPIYLISDIPKDFAGELVIKGRIYYLTKQETSVRVASKEKRLMDAIDKQRHLNLTLAKQCNELGKSNTEWNRDYKLLERANTVLLKEKETVERELADIYRSKGWKLLQFYRRIFKRGK